MPAKSKKQLRFMNAASHNPDFAKKVGIDPEVAEEYVSDNTGKKDYKNLPEKAPKFSRLRKMMKK